MFFVLEIVEANYLVKAINHLTVFVPLESAWPIPDDDHTFSIQLSSIEPILLSVNKKNTNQLVRDESQPKEGVVDCEKHSKVDKRFGDRRGQQRLLDETMEKDASQNAHDEKL
jgi:hypothetical protein